ncbi:hypothetical protein QQS21_003326 [Conoideocrella luteorostrata]|uniref:Zn(2)-C6 fungal-type domain-containing protein n=1 Tax=Conoideocrella luteorostrata TaxID=1105319 RepID=A0AAJ0CUF7_9HYPO|nr:hypothetical protein QQS21_003326 [Conoideocrella luteorostrata]
MHSSLESGLQSYSCFKCRQRKVKCDRNSPCSNCIKAGQHCSFVPPVRGKRKRTKPPRENLHAKLARYEALLKSYGASVDPAPTSDGSDDDTPSHPEHDAEFDASPQERRSKGTDINHTNISKHTKGKLVMNDGSSRYYESPLWSNLGNAFQHSEVEGTSDQLMNESDAEDDEALFGTDGGLPAGSIAFLHVLPHFLPRLKDIYIDRVDATVKILHLPAFWTALSQGLQQPEKITKSLEALIFSFYLSVISTLDETESRDLFKSSKSDAFCQYRSATRRALMNARLFSTSSLMTLQAFAMFMICVRNHYPCETLYILSGIAVRLARKMGLHRDGVGLGLSPFETEMRRRLWWHIVLVDFRVADVLGIQPSLDLFSADSKNPLNVNDEDLDPNMTEPPEECKGITSITLCLIRCEIVDLLKMFSNSYSAAMRWETLSNPDIPVAKKDDIISQIEDRLERKYIRYCDPSITLHTCVSIVIRSSICKMNLYAHNPRRFANSPTIPSDKERNIVFTNATKLLSYAIMMHGGVPGLEKCRWKIGNTYIWNVMLYVLIEVRHRRTGPEVEQAWELMGQVFKRFPQVSEKPPGAISATFSKWMLEVWADYVAAMADEGVEPSTPDYIQDLSNYHGNIHDSADRTAPNTQGVAGNKKIQRGLSTGDTEYIEPTQFYDFSDLMGFEIDPDEWLQWEQLLADQGAFT